MKPLRTLALSSILVVACAATFRPAPVSLSVRVITSVAAPDTLAMSASWELPADDGRGAIDSLRVVWVGIRRDSTIVYLPPFPTSGTMRLAVPASAYPIGGGAATYPVRIIVTTYRRASATPLQSSVVNVVLSDVPPPPVTNLNFFVTKSP